MSSSRENQPSAPFPAFEATVAGSPVPPPSMPGDFTERAGDEIGPYRLVEPLGEGGMGSVWRAEQTHPVRRQVALKVIKPGMDSRRIIARFEAERQALALMDHPNIAKVLDAGTTPAGRPFFVMELVGQSPITRYCDDHKLGLRDRLQLFTVVCEAIQHAHHKGIIHRDIKPSNVLITEQDGKPVPKVIDFGLAKALHSPLTDSTVMTEVGAMIGTPEYMSPEQAGATPFDVDTRSDVYSLGVLLYELLTGTPPFEMRKRPMRFDEVLRMIREDEPPKPSTRLSSNRDTIDAVAARRHTEPLRLGRDLRGELDWIVMKALEKDRDRRYQTANGMGQDVIRYLTGEPVSAGPPSPTYRLRKLAVKYRGFVTAAVLVMVALVIGMIGTTTSWLRAVRAEGSAIKSRDAEIEQRREAETQRDIARAAEQRAVEAEAVATAVNNFLRDDLLAQANPKNNPRQRQITVEKLLQKAAEQVSRKFEGQPRVEAAIRQTIGDTFMALGQYDDAGPQLKKARELYVAEFGPESAEALTAIGDLSQLFYHTANYDEAEKLLTTSLEVAKTRFGENDPMTVSIANNLASLLQKKGRHADAQKLFKQCYDTRLAQLGEKNPLTLLSLNNLALQYRQQGNNKEAEPLLVRCLALRRETLGPDRIETITTMNNLAGVYHDLKEHAKAEPLYEECLKFRREVLGDDHPDTLRSITSLADAYRNQKKFELAEPLFAEAYAHQRDDLGEDHPDTLTTMNQLVAMYMQRGQYARAEPLMVKNLELARKKLGDKNIKTLVAMNNLAKLYELVGKPAESEKLFRECIQLTSAMFGENNRNVLVARCSLATLLTRNNRAEEATVIFLDVLPRFRQARGDEHADTHTCIEGLTRAHLRQKQYDKAEPLAREDLAWREKKEPDDRLTIEMRVLLGESLLGQKKYAEAEPLLVKAYDEMKAKPLDSNGQSLKPEAVAALLAQLFEAQGQADKVAVWKPRAEGK
ncbi:MAG: serine/threonine-protein kinase [Gemmataceae bacterium]|nr:serine/threonine-protein kinase [Gemmataceae bacterium]